MTQLLFMYVLLFSKQTYVLELHHLQADSFSRAINYKQSETKTSFIDNTLVLRGSNIFAMQTTKQIAILDTRFGSIQTKITKVLKLKYMYPVEFLNSLQSVMPITSNLQGVTFSDCVILSGKPEEIKNAEWLLKELDRQINYVDSVSVMKTDWNCKNLSTLMNQIVKK